MVRSRVDKGLTGKTERKKCVGEIEELSLTELGDLLACGMRRAEESKLISRFVVPLIPLDLNATWQQLEVCSLIPRLRNQNMGLETLIHYPDATHRSSSMATTICPQDTLL